MKSTKYTQELHAFGIKFADVELEQLKDYFSVQLRFPSGAVRKLFISYDALHEKQEWTSRLQEALEEKKKEGA